MITLHRCLINSPMKIRHQRAVSHWSKMHHFQISTMWKNQQCLQRLWRTTQTHSLRTTLKLIMHEVTTWYTKTIPIFLQFKKDQKLNDPHRSSHPPSLAKLSLTTRGWCSSLTMVLVKTPSQQLRSTYKILSQFRRNKLLIKLQLTTNWKKV